jgi:hypothetical protein
MPDRFNGGEFVIRPRVFLADDHTDFLKAEIALLQPYFELVGIASDGASLVSEVQRLKPDVVVADITMPVMTGIEAVHELVKSGSTAKFVFPNDSFRRGIHKSLPGGRRSRLRREIPNESPPDSGNSCGTRRPAVHTSVNAHVKAGIC